MRSVLFHIAAGLIAAAGFLFSIYEFDTGGFRQIDASGVAVIFALVALFFLSVQLILAKLSQDAEHVRIETRDRRR